MTAWGLRSKGGIVTEAPNEAKARKWAGYDFKGRIGDVGEVLVKQDPISVGCDHGRPRPAQHAPGPAVPHGLQRRHQRRHQGAYAVKCIRPYLPWYREMAPSDLVKVMPADHKLAVLKLPFTRKFSVTWWLDGDGKLAKKS